MNVRQPSTTSESQKWHSAQLRQQALNAALAAGNLETSSLSRIPAFARRDDVDQSLLILDEALRGASSLPSAAPRVVWVGKTMAGKSTIFEALTDGRRERVGRGAQRTTLAPEARERDGLVMVDTPGVGARDGTADLSLAIDEAFKADALVWVVAESIQLSVTEAIAIMAGLGKPVVVLVNAKWRLADPDLRDHFLRRPERVLLREFDDQAKRVRHVLEQAGAAPSAVVPVHCEAALVAREMESTDAALAARLWSASNVEQAWHAIQSLIRGRSVALRLCAKASQAEDLVVARAKQLEDIGEDLDGWLWAREQVTQEVAKVAPNALADAKEAAVTTVLAVADSLDVSAWVDVNLKRKDINERWVDTVAGLKPGELLAKSLLDMASQFDESLKQAAQDWADDFAYGLRAERKWAWSGGSNVESLKPGRRPWADLAKAALGVAQAARLGLGLNPVAGVVLGVSSFLASVGRIWSRRRLQELQRRQALETKLRESLNRDLDELRWSLVSEVDAAARFAMAGFDENVAKSLEHLARAHDLPSVLGEEAEAIRSGLKVLPRALFIDAASSQGVLVHSDEVAAVERAPGFATKVLVTRKAAAPFARIVRMPERTDVVELGWGIRPTDRVLHALGIREVDWCVSWDEDGCTVAVPRGALPSVLGAHGANREAAERLLGHRVIVVEDDTSRRGTDASDRTR